MNGRKAVPWVVGAVALVGIACVAARVLTRSDLQLGDGDSLWRLTYTIQFRAHRTGAKIQVALPSDTRNARLFRQDVHYSGLTADRLRPSRSQTREVTLATTSSGKCNLTARFDLHVSRRAPWRAYPPEANLSADARALWLKSSSGIQASSAAVTEALQPLLEKKPADTAQRIFDYCNSEIQQGEGNSPRDAERALAQQTAAPLGRVRAMVALCRAAKIPARIVTGFEIKEEDGLRPHHWVEALTNGHWEPFDPVNGFAHELPHNFVPVRRDGLEIVHVKDASDVQATYALVQLPPGPGFARPGRRHLLDVFDLTRLPLEMHEVLSLILLLPLGALVTAIFRTIIGIRTFGTFTPTLIALSFVFADWRTGIFVFVVVISLGLVTRKMVDRLKLLMVPRLSVILTFVVLLIVFAISLLDFLRLTPSAQAVLLPMVILTMTIERFYLTSEEDGTGFALQLMAGTLLVAFCCYLVLRWDEVGRILFIFPEVHLLTIALLIVIGRYTGYRLTELWRFRDLAQGV